MECYEQVLKKFDESEHELEHFLQSQENKNLEENQIQIWKYIQNWFIRC